MPYCAKCGTMVPDGAAACPSCGQAQASTASTSSGGGLAPNIAGALAYIWIIAIIWLVLEPYNKDRFVRFHAFQSLALTVAWFGFYMVLAFIPIIGWVLIPFAMLGGLALWIFCLYKAYNNEQFKLPVIGDWAMSQAG